MAREIYRKMESYRGHGGLGSERTELRSILVYIFSLNTGLADWPSLIAALEAEERAAKPFDLDDASRCAEAIRERFEVEWINDKAGPYWHCRDPRCDGRWTDPLVPAHAEGCRALAAERLLAALPERRSE